MIPSDFLQREKEKYGLILNVDFSNVKIIISNQQSHIFDDHYSIDVNHGIGTITAIHERSALLAFYHLLRSIGVKFLGPGSAFERYPKINQKDINLNLSFTPRYKYRTVCIEGSVNLEHVIDMIDYLPKVAMNGYFIQFDYPLEFFERWYKEQDKHIDIDDQKIVKYKNIMIDEIKKRGLIYHAVGHGWTTKVLNIEGMGWHKKNTEELSINQIEMLAEVQGERKLYKDIPLNTQLCYSQPKVQELLAQKVLEYLLDHKEIDVLHFWLADDFYNFCTCNTCKKNPPSYYYVQILNLIDELLTKHHIDTKIAFLAYYELLIPPHISIKNEERFILMFAPITRTYAHSMRDIDVNQSHPDDLKQEENFSTDLKDNLKYLSAWKKQFHGDSFIFDYHLMWDGFKEISHMNLSQIIYDDIDTLSAYHLNGYISCQVTRQQFPHGLGMYILTKSLSVHADKFSTEAKQYFLDLYGKEGEHIYTFFDQVKSYIPHAYIRGEDSQHEKVNMIVREGSKFIKSFFNVFEDITLNIYVKYLYKFMELIEFKTINNDLKLKEKYDDIIKFMYQYYDILETRLDYFYLKLILKEFVDLKYQINEKANAHV